MVEGHGDVKAVPILVSRIASELYSVHYVEVPPPYRVRRNRLLSELPKAVMIQATRSESRGGVLVIADADDDCAVELAQQLREAAAPTPIEVAIAVREFEAWFLGAVESLRAHRAVRDKATFDGDPERLGGAKGHLAALMTESYRETLHQPAFAALMDLASARRVRSFEHLVGCVGRLLGPSSPQR
ncbi:MAG: DUF4276 family protein [Micromonosporaceae bacterium]